ncbi:MAG: hypothetical protein AAF386_07465, partial [Pseudomonadota bacterium]
AQARMAWNSPDDQMVFMIKDPSPVVPGGRETGQVGPADNPYVTAHADWIITNSGEQLVYAETLEADGMALTTSLACAILEPKDGGTKLTLSLQITSFTGEESIAEVSEGWTFAVDALAEFAASDA